MLHVINGLGPGGAETVLYRLATYPSGIDHEVISLEGQDWYSKRLEDAGITVHHLQWRSAVSAPAVSLRLYRLIRASNADLIQAWMYRSNVIAGVLSRLAHKPVVWNVRCSSLEPLRPASRFVARLSGSIARWVPDFVINCSQQSAELHKGLGYGIAEGSVIPNGYDVGFFYPDPNSRAKTRELLRIKSESFVIGSIGRWHPQKGFPVLLRAMQLLRGKGTPARLLLMGRGMNQDNGELASLIRDSGCGDDIEFIGEQPDIRNIARALDLHVLASIGSEGFPNVVAETMLSGTPNVATDIGDAKLIVGGTGWIVPPGDAAELADAIQLAFDEWKFSPRKWTKRRKAASQWIADNFSLEVMARSYERVWRKVVGSGRSLPDADT